MIPSQRKVVIQNLLQQHGVITVAEICTYCNCSPENGLNEAVANGTAVELQPGQQFRTELCAVAYRGLDRILAVTEEGEVEGRIVGR